MSAAGAERHDAERPPMTPEEIQRVGKLAAVLDARRARQAAEADQADDEGELA